ncbi:MAG: ABC transporter permease [Nitrososphaerales archaeon]
MRPLLYDIKKTFTSTSVIISMVLLIVISLFLINSFATTVTPNYGNNANTQLLSWYESSGVYHFLAFSSNQFGQPVSGVAIQANLTEFNPAIFGTPKGNLKPIGPVYRGPAVSTNSSGEAEFTINAPVNENYTVYTMITTQSGFPSLSGGFETPYATSNIKPGNSSLTKIVPIPPGQIVSILDSPVLGVTDTSNSQLSNILVTWAGANGSLPSNYSIYYKFVNVTETCTPFGNGMRCTSSSNFNPDTLNESSMTLLKNITSYSQVITPPKLEPNLASNSLLYIGLFYPNGTKTSGGGINGVYQFLVDQTYGIQNQQVQTQNIGQTNQMIMSFFLGIYGLFIPLIAIIVGYTSYGKDRVSGVLESVLAQPVSRRGLSLSRFISSFVALAIAISISMGVVDGIVWYFTKSFVSANIMLASAGAFFVELAAFIGIMMLLSHVFKSSGALIGIGIGLFIVIDFFWGLILDLVFGLTHTQFGSLSYYTYSILAEYFNPAQFVGLVDSYITGQFSLAGVGGIFFPFTPGQYGLSIPAIVASGLLWAILPLIGFLYLAIKRD